jgi:DHA2 family methylenomycin A resistance protein-like MFS transporter
VSWRAIFFINLPVGVATLAVLARVPASARRSVRLDLAGQVTASVALAALTAGVIEGGGRGFGAPVPLACLLLSAAAATAFLIAEARAAYPMVPLRLFQSRIVTVCVVIGLRSTAPTTAWRSSSACTSSEYLASQQPVPGSCFSP